MPPGIALATSGLKYPGPGPSSNTFESGLMLNRDTSLFGERIRLLRGLSRCLAFVYDMGSGMRLFVIYSPPSWSLMDESREGMSFRAKNISTIPMHQMVQNNICQPYIKLIRRP